jgi:phage-related protein
MSHWSVETLSVKVDAELESMPIDMLARYLWIAELIESVGLEKVGMPYIKSLGNKLWEIRFKGKDGNGRGIYITAFDKRVVVLHAFVKKTQKTPQSAIQTALSRAKEANLL